MASNQTTLYLEIGIVGVSPLLMHRFSEEDQLGVSDGYRGSSGTQDRGTAEEQAERFLYRAEDGHIILP